MIKCHLCGQTSSPAAKYFLANPRKFGHKVYSYLTCPNCGVDFLYPYTSKSDLGKIYSDPVYFKKLSQSTNNRLLDRLLSFQFYPSCAQYVFQKTRSKGNVLDIGCGNGEFLSDMLELGWDIWGLDTSKVAVANVQKRLNLTASKIKVGEPTTIKFLQKFDVITMWHVLEHVPNPIAFLTAVKRQLQLGGKLILEVPNSDSLVMGIFKDVYNWQMIPEHIFYYSPKSLAYLLTQIGFKEISFDFPPRAILNFSLSLYKYLLPRVGRAIARIAFMLSLPLTMPIALLATVLGRTEVVRVVANS